MPLRLSRRAGSSLWWLTGTIAGIRVRESTGTDQRELAEERRATREAELYRAAVHGAPAKRRTFAEVAESYLEHAGPHAEGTKLRVRRLLLHFGAALAADAVDQARLDQACAALLRPNPSPATRLREVITPTRAILTHGAKRRMCALPVFDAGRASPARTEWLTPPEVVRLVDNAAPHLRPLLIFLAGTGARLGEALRLEWVDVDLTHARAVLRDTKNGSDRVCDLCPHLVSTLKALPEPRGGVVFRTRSGEPYTERRQQGGGHIKTAWASALRKAGISRDVSPHSLRHTWASWHYASHRDILLLKREGGWSSVTLVERYAHLAPPTMAAEIGAWRATGTILTQGKHSGRKSPRKSKT
jgi:integrase